MIALVICRQKWLVINIQLWGVINETSKSRLQGGAFLRLSPVTIYHNPPIACTASDALILKEHIFPPENRLESFMVRNLNSPFWEQLIMNTRTSHPFDNKVVRGFMYENAIFVVFLI